MISPLTVRGWLTRLAAVAACGLALLAFTARPSAAQACYPPGSASCPPPITVPEDPEVGPNSTENPEVGSNGTAGTEAKESGNFAKTGIYAVPATAAGLGFVACGLVLRRSAKKRKTAAA